MTHIQKEHPQAVFIGGDLLPGGFGINTSIVTFLQDHVFSPLQKIRTAQPDLHVFAILGNDDPKSYEPLLEQAHQQGLLTYMNQQCSTFHQWSVCGYPYVSPSPFQLKDWERFDVSQFTDLGCVSPIEGMRSVPVDLEEEKHRTIKQDLKSLSKQSDPRQTIYLFHTPPYNTDLDRTDLDGKTVDHAPLDVHTGSIAVKRFIKKQQPLLTLHGHIHETVRLTGNWKQKIGETWMFSAAHDGPELSLIRFDPEKLASATRELL